LNVRLQTELAVVVLGFAALNLVLVFASIGLFVRMGPAVETILLRNDATIAAAEELLEAIARNPSAVVPEADRNRVALALERISNNVTEDDEPTAIDAIKEDLGPALEGDAIARRALIDGLRRLIGINRQAMLRADREAQRLGEAGAWTAVFVAIVSLGLCLTIGRRLGSRVVRPLLELRLGSEPRSRGTGIVGAGLIKLRARSETPWRI
jgi:hypothetical protein